MPAERARAMVVLAVDIVCDGAPKGHEARTGRHGQEKSKRQDTADDFAERYPGLCLQRPRFRIERHEAVEANHGDEPALRIQHAIAIGPPQANGQDVFPPGPRQQAEAAPP